MDIIKILKDYELSNEQKIFANAIKPRISTYTCSERIKNKHFLRKYFSPENDFLVYSTAMADPAKLIRRKVG